MFLIGVLGDSSDRLAVICLHAAKIKRGVSIITHPYPVGRPSIEALMPPPLLSKTSHLNVAGIVSTGWSAGGKFAQPCRTFKASGCFQPGAVKNCSESHRPFSHLKFLRDAEAFAKFGFSTSTFISFQYRAAWDDLSEKMIWPTLLLFTGTENFCPSFVMIVTSAATTVIIRSMDKNNSLWPATAGLDA